MRGVGSLQFVSRHAILVAKDPDLFDSVRGTLLRDGRFIDAGDMIRCDGSAAPSANIYPIEMTAADWAGWSSGGSPGPDVRTASTLLFECRSPSWAAEVSRLLAENLAVPIWLVDSADNVCPLTVSTQNRSCWAERTLCRRPGNSPGAVHLAATIA